MNTITPFLLVLGLLLVGCVDSQTSERSKATEFSIDTATYDRAKDTYDGSATRTSANAEEVRKVVSAIDWTSGKTRTALLVAPVGLDSGESYLSFQHEMNVDHVRVIAFWKKLGEESPRRFDGADEETIQRLVDAYTRGQELTDVVEWSVSDQ